MALQPGRTRNRKAWCIRRPSARRHTHYAGRGKARWIMPIQHGSFFSLFSLQLISLLIPSCAGLIENLSRLLSNQTTSKYSCSHGWCGHLYAADWLLPCTERLATLSIALFHRPSLNSAIAPARTDTPVP